MIYDLRAIVTLSLRELFRLKREPARVFVMVFQPLLFWALLGMGFYSSFQAGSETQMRYTTYFFPGSLALVLLFGAIFSTMSLIEDRHQGALQALLAGPFGRKSLVFGKILGFSFLAVFQALFFIAFAPLADISFAQVHYGQLLLAVWGGAFLLSTIGFIMAWWSDSTSTYHALMSAVLIPMWLLSGAVFPLEGYLAMISVINPVTTIVELLKIGLGLNSWSPVPYSILLVFVITALLLSFLVCEKKR